MSHLRTLKINDVNNSSEHILNKKRMTLYNNTKNIITNFSNSNSNCTLKTSNKNVKYLPPINVTSGSCLVSAKNYEVLLDVTKGKYLKHYSCSGDILYSLTGNINDANILLVDSSNNTKISSSREIDDYNLINISNQIMTGATIYKTPGVEIVQDYSYSCDESFFNMNTMQEDIISSNYYNKLGRQDKLYGFKYPTPLKIN